MIVKLHLSQSVDVTRIYPTYVLSLHFSVCACGHWVCTALKCDGKQMTA